MTASFEKSLRELLHFVMFLCESSFLFKKNLRISLKEYLCFLVSLLSCRDMFCFS